MTARHLEQLLHACSSIFRSTIFHQIRCASSSQSSEPRQALEATFQDAHRTLRSRREGYRSLPLPPVIDPVVVRERAQWEAPKARPNLERLTPFQQRLYSNPYAHILSSPIRTCRATDARLPDALMITLNPKPHPKTSEPWLVPAKLLGHGQLTAPFAINSNYTIASYLTKKSNWRRCMSARMVEKLSSQLKKLVWREDMSEHILSLLQQTTFGKLRWHLVQPGRIIVRVDSARESELNTLDDVACVLYLRSIKTRADEVQQQAEKIVQEVERIANRFAQKHKELISARSTKPSHPPPGWYRGPLIPRLQSGLRYPRLEMPTARWKGRDVAVYSLYDLLGEEKMRELVKGTGFEDADCVVVKESRHTVSIQMLLMQLQAYLAVPGP